MALPGWVLEFLLKGRGGGREAVKMSFVLEPQEGSELDVMPNGYVAAPRHRLTVGAGLTLSAV